MSQARFVMEKEVAHPGHPQPEAALWLQWGSYHYADGSQQCGYRFIWTRPDGSIQSRGPARIPALADIDVITALARQQGWGNHKGP
jgi:hypothetical protein